MTRRSIRRAAWCCAAAAGAAAVAYAAHAATTWRRYGRPPRPGPDETDPLLDRFIPVYDIVERHDVRVAAPARITLGAAVDLDLFHVPFVRAIIRAREIVLGAGPDDRPRPPGLLNGARALGWGLLAEVEGREVVVGAVTRPWEPNVTFRALPPERFAAFDEPEYVKIAWTLRADAADDGGSIFRTETRAVATDPAARARFRQYWALLSPGIIAIRWAALGRVRREAERRAHAIPPAPR